MVITKLQGGLANQLFQWAYGKSLSEKYNTPLYLDLSFYQNQFGVTKRDFSLNKFPNLKYQILPSDRNISNWSTESNKNKISNLSDNFIYSKLNYEEDSHYYLNGYWQSEKYFTEVEDIIREELKPSDNILIKLESFPFINSNNVSIHIRRTDYVISNGYHPVQSIEYYKKGLEIIGDYDNLLVFSDDINWCKENLKFDNMIFVEDNDDIEDLWLMSLCNHNIIANSSFSWWGAWLNDNKDKKVIAPNKWFGKTTGLNQLDIIPEKWIKI
jgi:hypothetical protein